MWTFVHYLYGVHCYAVKHSSWRATLLMGLWLELVESCDIVVAFWQHMGEVEYIGDSWRNSCVDVIALMFGFYVAQSTRRG